MVDVSTGRTGEENDGYESPLRVNFCRSNSRNARLLYPTKLPRQPFAIEAVTGQFLPSRNSLGNFTVWPLED